MTDYPVLLEWTHASGRAAFSVTTSDDKGAREPVKRPWDEAERLNALAAYDILDSPRERDFDDIALLASAICGTPIAVVNLIGDRRQFFKAEVGLGVRETPIESSFCAKAILEDEFLIVPDASRDPRFDCNPLVTGEPRLRFYAGALLKTADELPIGTVCVLDFKPRDLSAYQQDALRILARQAMTQLELRRALRLQAATMAQDRLEADEVRASDERARLAQEAGRVGTFELDISSNKMIVSEEFCRLFGVPFKPTYDAAMFENLVVREDKAVVSSKQSRVQGSARNSVEYRIRRADDGRERWIARKSQTTLDTTGAPLRMFGAVQDVTDSKNAQARTAALLRAGDAFREATSSTDVFQIAGNALGDVLRVNRAGYERINVELGQFDVETDWTAEGVASIAGHHVLSSFIATTRRLGAGEILSVADVADAQWLRPDREAYAEIGVRAFLTFPIVVQGMLVGALFAHSTLPRRWAPGEIAFVRSLADRTHQALARVDAEEQRRILNNELAHRLKNTLAVVQSIANQTLRDAKDREAVNAFNDRLRSLAVSHDLLMRQSWVGARLHDVVEGSLSLHGDATRIRIEGPPVQLGPKAALSLSLILHEMATNAAKYGALSNPTGTISIAWVLRTEAKAPGLLLRWTEAGGPTVAAPDRTGFGSRLIGMGLGSGGARLEYEPSGLVAEFFATLRTLTALE